MITADFSLKRRAFSLTVNESFGRGITGIFGPSGSGKTTLLQVIAGLATPERGTITVNNRTLFDAASGINLPVHIRNTGYVFQNGRLFPHMTVERNLRYGMRKDRPPTMHFDDVVDLLGLRHLLTLTPKAISGGEYQRTALGRALLSAPDMLLLDEPFSAVDTGLRSRIIPCLQELQHRTDIAILVVSHEIEDLLQLTSRLCLIKNGTCIGHNAYHALLESPPAAELLGSGSILNAIPLNVQNNDSITGVTLLSSSDKINSIRIICEKSRLPYKIGREVMIFVRSHDISLSLHRVDGITIQNQLQGSVVNIFNRCATTFCTVDVGFRLVVEITAESRSRLDIAIGSSVWCLFKSVAIDVAT